MAEIARCKTRKVARAVFPVAGMATRFLSAVGSVPKGMLTLVDWYLTQEARAAGVMEFIFITARGKLALEDRNYHSRQLELCHSQGNLAAAMKVTVGGTSS